MKRKTEIIWSLWGRNTDVHTRALGYMIVYMLAWIHEGHLFDELVFYPDFTSQSSRICSGEKTHLSVVCHKNKDLLWREDVWLCRATRRLTWFTFTQVKFSQLTVVKQKATSCLCCSEINEWSPVQSAAFVLERRPRNTTAKSAGEEKSNSKLFPSS